jgi:aspartyl-tRNA(Asn)/glutamyl-tRNA(Gln) amidotransferase subunit A
MILNLYKNLKNKKISSSELTSHFLKKIKQDKTNSFLTVCEEKAIDAAKKADEKIKKGEQKFLTGIPLGIKDNICTKGVRTTCASKILENYVSPYDATVIAKLKASDFVMLGKLNLDEFAMGGSNENSAFGAVKNPVNLEYVPGGSSGGSAASMKAGLVCGTLGSDTGGSVRLPASYCGVVGLKPTYGRVSRYGLVAFASSLDQIGPITSSVEDSALILQEIAGLDSFDSTSAPFEVENYLEKIKENLNLKKKFKIGLPKEYFLDAINSDVRDVVQNVIEELKKQGHEFYEVSLPHTEYSVAVYYILAVSEASSNLARFDGVRYGVRLGSDEGLIEMYKKTRALFGEEVKRRILLGTFSLSAGYYDAYYKKACQIRRLIKNDFDEVFKKVDVLLTPVAPTTAYKIGEKISDPLKMYLNDILTIPVNLAGLPAISVPAGRSAVNGLPIGVQFIGDSFQESKILTLGKIVEDSIYKEEVHHELSI